jgi:hypothetical protein
MPNVQFMVITFASTIQVIYIGLARPYEFNWMNRLELFNDYLVLTCCIFLFAYSDGLLLMKNPGYPNLDHPEYDEALPDMESKYQLGWYNIGILGLLVVVNFSCMLIV